MSRINRTTPAQEYVRLRESSTVLNETNDCAVISLAAVTGVSYVQAHAALTALGRKPRRGTPTAMSLAAAKALGFRCTELSPRSFLDRYPRPHNGLRSVTTHHPERFNSVWADGESYLLFTRGHVLCVKNGVNLDWTRGSAKRVRRIFRVNKEG